MTLPARRVVGVAGVLAVLIGASAGVAWAHDEPGDTTGDRPAHIPAEEPKPTTPPTEPSTVADAQLLLDPTNDPTRLIGKNPDGSWYVLEVTVNGIPPAWVITVEDFRQWQQQLGVK